MVIAILGFCSPSVSVFNAEKMKMGITEAVINAKNGSVSFLLIAVCPNKS